MNTPISTFTDPSQETIKDNIDRALNGELAVSTIIEDTRSILKSSNTTSSNDIKIGSSLECQMDKNERISDILKNTQLPSRKKPSDNEPFERFLGMNYISDFLAASSIVIFCIGLFNK